MRKRIFRLLISLFGTISVLAALYYIYPIPQNGPTILLIMGTMVLILSFGASSIAPNLDVDDRFSYDELEDYEPNIWRVKTFGTRLIKSKSNPYVVYSFVHVVFVPVLPIGCHGYTCEVNQDTQESEINWCGAKWNIVDIAIIYWRWIGYFLIFAGLVKLFS